MAPKKTTTEAPKQKKPRAAKKEFMATMREKAEKRLVVLMKKKAKQQNLDIEIAELHRFLGIDSELAANGARSELQQQAAVRPIGTKVGGTFSFPASVEADE